MRKDIIQKARLNITLDGLLLQEVKMKVDNISALIESLLKAHLSIVDKNGAESKNDIAQEMLILEAQLNDLKVKKQIIENKEKLAKEEYESRITHL